jgi:hypothetical protein
MGDGATAVVRRRRTQTLPNGKVIELETLGFKDFAQVREEACAEYKRNLIHTYTSNLDLVPASDRDGVIMKAFEKAEKINPDDLPLKTAWLPKTNADGRIIKHSGETFYHAQAKQWIRDGEPLLEEQELEYAAWWMSYSVPGKIYATWLSMRKCPGQETLTRDDVDAMFVDQGESLEETANAVGELSQPRLGNSPPAVAQTAGKSGP